MFDICWELRTYRLYFKENPNLRLWTWIRNVHPILLRTVLYTIDDPFIPLFKKYFVSNKGLETPIRSLPVWTFKWWISDYYYLTTGDLRGSVMSPVSTLRLNVGVEILSRWKRVEAKCSQENCILGHPISVDHYNTWLMWNLKNWTPQF